MRTSTTERCVREVVGVENEPNIQQPMLSARRNALTQMAASTPRATPITQSRKSRVASRRKPMNCFTRTIQGPGRGTKRSQAGCALRSR